jgi:sortase (surface protein transpeptidase)
MKVSRPRALVGLVLSLSLVGATPLVVSLTRPRIRAGSLDMIVALPRYDRARLGRTSLLTADPGLRSHIPVHSARLEDSLPIRRSSPPTRVMIPSVGVNAPVVPVGVERDGLTMEVPTDVDDVGWYRFGPSPGQQGSAVLVGHVDARLQGPGAFFNLRRLSLGARVTVLLANGRSARFRVLARRSYAKGKLPNFLYEREGRAMLVLVTCGGWFDETTRHYSDNVVVFATALKEGQAVLGG